MKIKIKEKYSEKIKLEGESETFREFVEKNRSDLREADLYEADLYEADLYGANLYGANLCEADLRGAKIKVQQIEEIVKSLGILIEK